MSWKVVSTHFGKLEESLTRLDEDGFSVWKLVILSPESTRTKRFVVIIIANEIEHVKTLPSEIGAQSESTTTKSPSITFFSSSQEHPSSNNQSMGAVKTPSAPGTYRNDHWEGKLVDPGSRSSRRMGRFDADGSSK